MGYVYANLMTPVNTGSGVAEYLLLAPVTSFTDDGIKCPAAPFTNPGDEVTIKEAHVFKTGEGFIKVQLAPEKNKLDAATIGDRGFSKLDITLEIFIPGSYAIVHEAVKNWVNKPLVALIKDGECTANMYYQLGCDCASTWLTVDFSTGTTKDGVKGYTGKLSYQNGYIQVYMGPAPTIKGATVVTPPATFDTILPFANSAEADNSEAFINAIIPAVSADTLLKVNKKTIMSGQEAVMYLKNAATNSGGGHDSLMTINTYTMYNGDQMDYDVAGVAHLFTFQAGTTLLITL